MAAIDETPRQTRHGLYFSAAVFTHGHPRLRVVQVDSGIGRVITIRQWQGFRWLIGAQAAAHKTFRARHARRVQRHQAIAPWHIDLPADPCHCVTLPHQKTVAKIFFGGGVGHARCAVKHFNRHFAPAIGYIEKQCAVAFAHVHGLQHVKVTGEFHQALRIAWGQCDIGDALMQRMRGVHRKAHRAGYFFVGAGSAKGFAV